MPSRRWSGNSSGYEGPFGDSFFSDCWEVMDKTGSYRRRIAHENVADDIPDEKVKPWFRKTHLSRMNDDDIYQVMLEVSNFLPSELSVKLVNDKTITVQGKHGERAETEGFVSREFTRKYQLPESVVPSSVECFLSRDGVLVIRGHAPRSKNPHGRFSERHEPSNVIPIFTHGYQTHQANGNKQETKTKHHHTERIIPISQENGKATTTKQDLQSDQKFEDQSSEHSGRRSWASDRLTPSPQPKESDKHEMNGNGRRSRTVSFNDDDDTIASNSPIIEEPASTASNGPTPEPRPSSSRQVPLLSRQSNVEESFSERRSESRMSEERHERSNTPHSTTSNGSNRKDRHIEKITIDLDDHRDPFQSKELRSRSRTPLFDDFEKLHKDIIERHRHLSRESIEQMQRETDKFFETVKSRSPLMHRMNDDTYNSALKPFDHSFQWRPRVPPQSREEQYEKKLEQGYDKNGNWTKKFEEKMFSQQYSSTSTVDENREGKAQAHKQLEHPIKISSPA